MATRRCPRCKLINPGTTATCDCGWSFVEEKMTAPRNVARQSEDELEREQRSRGARQLGLGALFLLAGIVITAVTYGGASQSGGTYVIAYGPIVYGIYSIIRGIVTMSG
jgi:hypothetical protein